jgi:hypothetical protein
MKKVVKLLACIALFGGLFNATAQVQGKNYQSYPLPCTASITGACTTDEHGHPVGQLTYTPGSQSMCTPSHSGSCTEGDCIANGAPYTVACT